MAHGPGFMAPDELEHRRWLASLVDVAAAGTLVDLGSGNGRDLALIAERARPDTSLIGMDVSAAKLDEARERLGTDKRITLVRHDVGERLPLADASVDVAFSNNLLECVGDPQKFLREVHRVLRPGGQVVCAHWDWDSQSWNGSDKDLIRRAVHAWADWQQDWMEHADGWMGRRLWGVFHQSGRFEGAVATRVLTNTEFADGWFGHARIHELEHLVGQGLLSAGEHQRLLADAGAFAAAGRYFYSICCYVYVGRKRVG